MIATVLRPRALLRLFASDAMSVSRDPMLIFAIVMSILPPLALAFWHGALDDAALAYGVESASRYVAMVALVLPAVLVGWVTGFLLLEDRDDGVLLAVDVTPAGKVGFLVYRTMVAGLVGGAITLGSVLTITPWLEPSARLLVVVAVALETVLAAVLLPSLARNKVEGLALTKLMNIATVVPLLALVPSPWRFIAGVVPTYWIGELLRPQADLPLWAIGLAALATHVAALVLLLRLFARKVG
jgi:fluoroquinolone transport system permease protein